jgi:hypothetical protein
MLDLHSAPELSEGGILVPEVLEAEGVAMDGYHSAISTSTVRDAYTYAYSTYVSCTVVFRR